MESNGVAPGEGPLPLKKRKTAARGAAAGGHVDDDAPLPLSAVKKSKRAAASSHESEFVSVEVGLREFHKRMASSGSTPTKRTATSKTKKSKDAEPSGKDAQSVVAKKPAASRKKIAVEVTEDEQKPTLTPTPPKRRAPTKAKTVAAPVSEAAAAVAVAKTAAPTPKKRATPVKRATTDVAKPSTSAAATKRAAAKPKVAPSDALAQARAAAMQQQQERVQQRVQGLQRAVETSAPPVSSAASQENLPSREALQQQQQEQGMPPPCEQVLIEHGFHPPQQPSPQQAQPRSQQQAELQQQQQRDHRQLPLPARSGALEESTDVMKQEIETSQSSQGFIEEDFDEDLVFLQALEEVERKLQPTTISSDSSPPSSSHPVAATHVASTSIISSSIASAPVASAFIDSAPLASPPALSVPVPSAPGASAPHVITTTAVHSLNDSSVGQEQSTIIKQEQSARDSTIPEALHSAPAIPPELLAEYERLKRENEALRRSNDKLQAERATQPAGATAGKETLPTAVASIVSSPEAHLPPCGIISSRAELSPTSISPINVIVNQAPDATTAHPTVKSIEPLAAAHRVDTTSSGTTTPSLQDEFPASIERVTRSSCEAQDKLLEDTEMASVGDDTVEYGDQDEEMDVGEENDSEEKQHISDQVIQDRHIEGEGMEEDEDGEMDEEDNGDSGETNVVSRASTIDRGNYSQYRAKDGEDLDDDDEDSPPLPRSGPRISTAHRSTPLTNAVSQKRTPVVVSQPSAATIAAMPPPIVDDGSETESDEELQLVNRRQVTSLPESSSSSSSEESDEENTEASTGGSNVLEAALRAATGRPPVTAPAKEKLKRYGAPPAHDKPSPEKRARVQVKVEHNNIPSSAPEEESTSANRKAKTRRVVAGSTMSAKDKSSLMWPTLDDFYDFVLDLTPRRVLHSDPLHLQLLRAYEKARARLPMHYPGITQYCSVQQESILEELLSSVRNAEEVSLHNSSRGRLWLSSISPCSASTGHSATLKNATTASSSAPLNSNVIFMESGFSGTSAAGKSDFIVTFQEGRVGPNQKSALSDFVSGDLLAIRSPEWRGHDVYAFGIVLCSSVVAVGGAASSHDGSGSSSNPDQLCVLIRAPSTSEEDPDAASHFASVMEMCLVNQGSSQWSWSLEQVHNLTTSAREFQAIKSVRFFKPETKEMLMSGIIPEIIKSEQTQIIEPRKKLTSGLYEELETKYNPSQLHAILGAISDDSSISIIQGPPGTGKTKTILGVLSALLDGAALTASRQAQVKSRIRIGASLEKKTSTAAATQDKKSVAQDSIRVLVAAPSNAAVDELIVRLLSEGVYDARQRKSYRPRIVRVGRSESLQQQQRLGSDRHQEQDFTRKKKWRKYASEVEEILLENLVNKNRSAFPTAKQARQTIIQNAQIVFCTLSGAGSVAMCELQSQHFDALVIDEAAQAVEASLLIPFKFQPGRVVLVGDHRQLPATVISKRLIELGYDRSLFQRLVENGSRVFMLTQQYRMHPEISWFPSTYFYNSKLIEAPQMKEWTARKYHREPTFRPFVFYDVLEGQQSQVSGSKSLRNVNEIECILVLLTRLVVEQFPEMEWRRKIGIIAPYKQQIYELRNELQRWEKKYDKRLDIEVNTVDGFQGREKEVIIYSCVRTSRAGRGRSSNRQNGQTIEAFWADERRMNVAITRAKSSLWIIGNSTLLKQSAAWRALITHAKDSRRYISDEELMGATRSKAGSSGDRSRSRDRDRDRARSRSRDRSQSRDRRRR